MTLVVLIMVFIPLFLLSLLLLSGRGAWLIAGYNTASAEQKARYNEKRLTKVIGSGLLFISLLTLLSIFFPDPTFLTWLPFLIIPISLAMIGVANSSFCKVTSAKGEGPKKGLGKKLLLLLPLMILLMTLFVGSVKVVLGEDALTLKSSFWTAYQLSYQDVEKLELLPNHPHFGNRSFGVSNMRILAGRFEEKKLGNYVLYCNKNCLNIIRAQTKEGVVMFNAANEKETETIYRHLVQSIPGVSHDKD